MKFRILQSNYTFIVAFYLLIQNQNECPPILNDVGIDSPFGQLGRKGSSEYKLFDTVIFPGKVEQCLGNYRHYLDL